MKFKHFIAIRFAIGPLDGTNVYEVPIDEEWVYDRIRIFGLITGPCIKAQTHRNFKCLLFVDSEISQGCIDELQKHLDDLFEIVYVGSSKPLGFPGKTFNGYIRTRLDGATHVITTRIDSDNAIVPHFVEAIQHTVRSMPSAEPYVVDFPTGLRWQDGRMFLLSKLSTIPFPSLISSVHDGKFKHVYYTQHPKLGDHFPVYEIQEERPSWIHVIHKKCLSFSNLDRENPTGRRYLEDAFSMFPISEETWEQV